MCSDRLAAAEPPACVQACPNGAITITVVEQRKAALDAQRGVVLPGAPSPEITIPTTQYVTVRTRTEDLLPADLHTVAPWDRHARLSLMLVLAQLSVGALWASVVAGCFFSALVAASSGLLAMATGLLHLGRPLYAFRAVLGLRTSWLSREIVALGLFVPLSVAHAAACWRAPVLEDALGALGAVMGLVFVTCSVLVYHVTRRPGWSAGVVGFKFFLTAVVLGLATTMVTFAGGAVTVAPFLVTATLLKLGGEIFFFRRPPSREVYVARFTTSLAGGVMLPLLGHGLPVAVASLLLLVTGELLERTLFFATGGARG
jgi:formate dehydrogenase iron-sulfur subunit